MLYIILSLSVLLNTVVLVILFLAQKNNNRLMQLLEKAHQKHTNVDITGLPNRKSLLNFLANVISQSPNSKVSVLELDLDNFKSINESLGFSMGDKVLKEVAKRISGILDNENIFIAHTGVDEFAIVIPNCNNSTQSMKSLANSVIDAIAQPFIFDELEILTSCSIGIATYPKCASDAESLLSCADIARNESKKLGKNIYSSFTEDMISNGLEKNLIIRDMKQGLKNNEFYMCYQPQLDLKTNQIIGVESLVRWNNPKRGLVPPAVFIPIAEESGFILTLGDWIITQALADLKKINNLGFDKFKMSVNLSIHQLNNSDIISHVSELIWQQKVDSNYVEVELTEGMVMANAEKSMLMLNVLKSMGVNIAMDDFGTGYSSFGLLNQFPLTTLKIDQIFIRGLEDDVNKQVIVSSIISMAAKLGLKVIAEGVETEFEKQFLIKENCDIIQGYHYSKPLKYNDLISFINNN